MEATSFLLIKSVLFWKRQTNHYKSELNNPNHYCQCLTLITIIRPADTDVFLVITSLHLKSNASYFSGGEKQQLEIRLCLQAVPNPNHDINKSVGLTQTGRMLGREKPPVFLFPVLLQCISFSPMQPRPYPPPRGTWGFKVLRHWAFFQALFWYRLALQDAVFHPFGQWWYSVKGDPSQYRSTGHLHSPV